MDILILNFHEAPENYHLEQTIVKNALKFNHSIEVIHNFKNDYSKLDTSTPYKRRHFKSITVLKKYDCIISIDLPWNLTQDSVFYLKVLKQKNAKKLLVTNHLLPLKGESKFYDYANDKGLLNLFKYIYIYDFEDAANYPNVNRNKIIKRKYYIDTDYYRPSNTAEKNKKFTIFFAGVKGRNYEKLIKSITGNMNLLIITNSNIKSSKPNVKILNFNKNIFNLKHYLSKSTLTILPVDEEELNPTAGIAIAFMSMAMGKPAVIRKNDYLSQYIKHEYNGFFYKKLSELLELLKYIYQNRDKLKLIGQNARKTVIQKASLNKFTREILKNIAE